MQVFFPLIVTLCRFGREFGCKSHDIHWYVAERAFDAVDVEFLEPEAEAEEPTVSEPVEAQLAAAGAGKDADICTVVMVGWLPCIYSLFIYFGMQRPEGKVEALLPCRPQFWSTSG